MIVYESRATGEHFVKVYSGYILDADYISDGGRVWSEEELGALWLVGSYNDVQIENMEHSR